MLENLLKPDRFQGEKRTLRRNDADPTVLFHPDCTVGSGVSPDLLTPPEGGRSRAVTAGGEFHPALRTA
jgi:hypothetical protein